MCDKMQTFTHILFDHNHQALTVFIAVCPEAPVALTYNSSEIHITISIILVQLLSSAHLT